MAKGAGEFHQEADQPAAGLFLLAYQQVLAGEGSLGVPLQEVVKEPKEQAKSPRLATLRPQSTRGRGNPAWPLGQ